MKLVKLDERSEVVDGAKYTEIKYELGRYKFDYDVAEYKDRKVERFSFNGGIFDENYLPQIYFEERFGCERFFSIMTTSYGSLKTEEIKKVIEGYQEAVEAVEILEKEFCK